jgi:hypothetical protein
MMSFIGRAPNGDVYIEQERSGIGIGLELSSESNVRGRYLF